MKYWIQACHNIRSPVWGLLGLTTRNTTHLVQGRYYRVHQESDLEAAPYNVRVNAVAPGFIATDMVLPLLTEEEKKEVEAGIPLQRLGEPEDIGEAVAFLASDLARYITGETLHVNGGLIMY